jgi:hypothetical protein
LRFIENNLINNMYFDMLFTLDNEFYVKFREECQKVLLSINKSPIEVDDEVNFI